jgi:hypothetical protein
MLLFLKRQTGVRIGPKEESVMRLGTVALIVAIACAAPAIADEPAPSNSYAVTVWAAPSGNGIAVTLGPVTADQCTAAITKSRSTHASFVPPDMQVQVSNCVPQLGVSSYMAAFGCVARTSGTTQKYPNAVVWTYSCFRS